MNKFILTTLMILATAGCFAKLPDMKKLGGEKTITNRGQILYSHSYEKRIPLYLTGTFKCSYLENFDPLTKCTYTVYGLYNGDKMEPTCFVEDFFGETHISRDYQIVEKNDHRIFYFYFTELDKEYNFIVISHFDTKEMLGYFSIIE